MYVILNKTLQLIVHILQCTLYSVRLTVYGVPYAYALYNHITYIPPTHLHTFATTYRQDYNDSVSCRNRQLLVVPRYYLDINEILPRQCLDITEILPRQCLYIREIIPRQCLDISEIVPRQCLDITEIYRRVFPCSSSSFPVNVCIL